MKKGTQKVLQAVIIVLSIVALSLTGFLTNSDTLSGKTVNVSASAERDGSSAAEDTEEKNEGSENAAETGENTGASDDAAEAGEDTEASENTAEAGEDDEESENTAETEEPAENEEEETVVAHKLKGTITLLKDNLELGRYEVKQINTVLRFRRIDGALSFRSSDKSVVTVNKMGEIKAKGLGTATITIAAENALPVELKVTVYRKPTRLTLNVSEVTLNRDKTKKLDATVNEGAFGDITYTSSNPGVAKVSRTGKITAVKKGNCTISAITYNGLTQEVAVNVRPDMKEWKISDTSLRVSVGTTKELTVKYTPKASYEKITYTSSDTSVATVTSAGKIKGVGKGTAVITAYCAETEESQTCEVEVYYAKQIAITFDDGPGYYSEQLLDALKEYDVKVTFFYIGNLVDKYASSVKRAKEEGHEIGCHSWGHPVMSTLSSEEIDSQFSRTNKAIKNACGSYPTVFRPPYGSTNSTVNSKAGMPVILWNVDTLDWKYRDSDRLYNYLLDNAADGQIILMHEIHGTTIKGVIRAIPELKKRGFEFVTVTELLSRYGEEPQAGVRYSQSPKLKAE